MKYVIVFGILVWLFLLWDRMETRQYEAALQSVDNAETTDRCAEFRQAIDGESWSLGYGGRLRQLVRGCF